MYTYTYMCIYIYIYTDTVCLNCCGPAGAGRSRKIEWADPVGTGRHTRRKENSSPDIRDETHTEAEDARDCWRRSVIRLPATLTAKSQKKNT